MQAQSKDLGLRESIESLWISLRRKEPNNSKHQLDTSNINPTYKDLIGFTDELKKKSYRY